MERWVVVAGIVTVLGACNNDGDGRDDHAITRLDVALQQRIAECGCQVNVDPDADPAESTWSFPDIAALEITLGNGDQTFDPRCLDRMVEWVATLPCDERLQVSYTDICPLYHGTLFEGSDCGTVVVEGNEGFDDGSTDDSTCGPGLWCLNGRCQNAENVRLGEDGQPCDLGERCDEGLYCSGTAELCVRLPGLGAPCPDRTCAEGLRCQGAQEEVCEATTPDGGACMGHAECASGNCPAGRCAQPGGVGESCVNNLPCAAGLDCVEAVCTGEVLAGDGGFCSSL